MLAAPADAAAAPASAFIRINIDGRFSFEAALSEDFGETFFVNCFLTLPCDDDGVDDSSTVSMPSRDVSVLLTLGIASDASASGASISTSLAAADDDSAAVAVDVSDTSGTGDALTSSDALDNAFGPVVVLRRSLQHTYQLMSLPIT